MHYEDDRAGWDTDNLHHNPRHGGDRDNQLGNTGQGTAPGITVPPTVLLTALDNGTLLLQGRPDGPRAYLSPADAAPLKRELAVAFRRTERRLGGDQDNVR